MQQLIEAIKFGGSKSYTPFCSCTWRDQRRDGLAGFHRSLAMDYYSCSCSCFLLAVLVTSCEIPCLLVHHIVARGFSEPGNGFRVSTGCLF